MRYIYASWRSEGNTYGIAHDFGSDDWTAKEVARWLKDQLDEDEYPTFAFEAITKERYDYYYKRKLTTKNFGQG